IRESRAELHPTPWRLAAIGCLHIDERLAVHLSIDHALPKRNPVNIGFLFGWIHDLRREVAGADSLGRLTGDRDAQLPLLPLGPVLRRGLNSEALVISGSCHWLVLDRAALSLA